KEKVRLFQSFYYKADSWSRPCRIVQKAEVTSEEGTNIRFVVTNFESSQASFIYDEIYCERGKMENYIKNHKTYLHSDRTSCHSFIANQFRLFLHSAAYVLLHRLQEIGLRGLELARAQFDTIQKKLLKVGSRVRELVTKIKFHFPTSFPLKEVFARIVFNLSIAFP
ncbi:MAG: transposase, partial [Elusimicrobiota bacterium]